MVATAVGGLVTFKADGENFSTKGDLTVTIQNEKSTFFTTTDQEVHFTSEAVPSSVSGTIVLTAGLDVAKVVGMRGVTITVGFRDGRIAVISNAGFSGDASISAQDGELDIEFMGKGSWLS